MGLVRLVPLLTTIAEVVDLTGVQGLANLEALTEFSAADTLLKAHQWAYDRLKRRYSTSVLATVTNTEELERAVAFRFMEAVAAAGYLGSGAGARAADEGARGYWGEQARDEVDGFQPELGGEADAPRAEGVPVVKNTRTDAFFP